MQNHRPKKSEIFTFTSNLEIIPSESTSDCAPRGRKLERALNFHMHVCHTHAHNTYTNTHKRAIWVFVRLKVYGYKCYYKSFLATHKSRLSRYNNIFVYFRLCRREDSHEVVICTYFNMQCKHAKNFSHNLI